MKKYRPAKGIATLVALVLVTMFSARSSAKPKMGRDRTQSQRSR